MTGSPVASVERLPTAVVIRVEARELRKREVDALCREVDQARAAAPDLPFIFDMACVYFAGSLALGTLVGLNQEFRTRGQRLIFAGFQQEMRHAIDVMGIGRAMELSPDASTALRSVEGDVEAAG